MIKLSFAILASILALAPSAFAQEKPAATDGAKLVQNLNSPPPASLTSPLPTEGSGKSMDVSGSLVSPLATPRPTFILGAVYDVSGGPLPKGGLWHQELTVEKMDQQQFCGTVDSPNAGRPCNRRAPYCGEIKEDGTVVMDSRGSMVIHGCERTWVLKLDPADPKKLTGRFTGPNKGPNPDGSYTIELVQKK